MSERGSVAAVTFTVIDIIRGLGYEPTPGVSWAVGSAVRDRYASLFGDAPMKALRTKTRGIGSHCFAIYPATFKEEAETLTRTILYEIDAVRRMQGDLFPKGTDDE